MKKAHVRSLYDAQREVITVSESKQDIGLSNILSDVNDGLIE